MPKPEERRRLHRVPQHAHLADAEVGEDLAAEAIGAHLFAPMLFGNQFQRRAGLLKVLNAAYQRRRRFFLLQDHHHARAVGGDARQRARQRPVAGAVHVGKQIEQAFLYVYAHQCRPVLARLARTNARCTVSPMSS